MELHNYTVEDIWPRFIPLEVYKPSEDDIDLNYIKNHPLKTISKIEDEALRGSALNQGSDLTKNAIEIQFIVNLVMAALSEKEMDEDRSEALIKALLALDMESMGTIYNDFFYHDRDLDLDINITLPIDNVSFHLEDWLKDQMNHLVIALKNHESNRENAEKNPASFKKFYDDYVTILLDLLSWINSQICVGLQSRRLPCNAVYVNYDKAKNREEALLTIIDVEEKKIQDLTNGVTLYENENKKLKIDIEKLKKDIDVLTLGGGDVVNKLMIKNKELQEELDELREELEELKAAPPVDAHSFDATTTRHAAQQLYNKRDLLNEEILEERKKRVNGIPTKREMELILEQRQILTDIVSALTGKTVESDSIVFKRHGVYNRGNNIIIIFPDI